MCVWSANLDLKFKAVQLLWEQDLALPENEPVLTVDLILVFSVVQHLLVSPKDSSDNQLKKKNLTLDT